MCYSLEKLHRLKLRKAAELLEMALDRDYRENLSNGVKALDRPEASAAFLYYCAFDGDDAFLADNYQWKDDRLYESKAYGVNVHYYYVATKPDESKCSKVAQKSSEFRRFVYSFAKNGFDIDRLVIVWYSGDHKLAANLPHENSRSNRPHLTTLKTAREDIKQNKNLKPSAKLTYCTFRK